MPQPARIRGVPSPHALHARLVPFLVLVALGLQLSSSPATAAEDGARAAADYARDLESSDRNLRREAAYQLSRMGREARVAVPQLIKALDDDQQQVWFGAIASLANLGPDAEPALPALIRELESWQPFRKDRQGSQALYRTALALGSIGAPAVPALSNALSQDKWFVKAGAARALGFVGPAARASIPALIRVLGDERAEVREAAAETIAVLGDSAVPRLIEMLKDDEEPRARIAAANTLRRLGTNAVAAIPTLGAAMEKDRDPAVRAEALNALGRCGLPGTNWVARLFMAAQDPSEPLRQAAFSALLLVRPVGGALMPRVLESLRSTDRDAVEFAARLVAELGVDARGAAPFLAEKLKGSGGEGAGGPDGVFTRAMAAIGEAGLRAVFGEVAERRPASVQLPDWTRNVLRRVTVLGLPVLSEGLTNASAPVRAAALEGITALGVLARSAGRRVQGLLDDPDEGVRARAWTAAAACGSPGETLTGRFDAALRDASNEVRLAALTALVLIDPDSTETVGAVVKALDDGEPSVRRAAAGAIARLEEKGRPAESRLFAMLSVDSEIKVAADALRAVHPTSMPLLLEALKHADWSVREMAADALARLGKSAADAVPILEKLMRDDPQDEVRRASRRAVRRIREG